MLGVAEKIYNVGRLGFFVRAQPKLCFRRHRHLFHLLAEENISQRRQKNMIHRYWSKKMLADVGQEWWGSIFKKVASPGDDHRTFPNRHHPNICQRLNRKYNSRHRSLWSRDWYFSTDIAQFFLQTLADNIFLRFKILFCWVCRKNLLSRSARFFRSSSTEVVFPPTPASFSFACRGMH